MVQDVQRANPALRCGNFVYSGAVTVEAFGAYVRVMREARKLKPDAVAKAMVEMGSRDMDDVNPNYIWRIERGKVKEPGAQRVLAFVRVVRGSAEIATNLLLDDEASADEGRMLAEYELEMERIRVEFGDEVYFAALAQQREEGNPMDPRVRAAVALESARTRLSSV